MKNGRTLAELAEEIMRQQSAKKDYLLDTRSLVMSADDNAHSLTMLNGANHIVSPLGINDIAHAQIGSHLNIPKKYYDRMRAENPELLTVNVNSWFERNPATRMVRTLDGTARAFLSDRYRRIDNFEIAEVVLPIIGEMQDAHIESCEITEQRMYVKVVNPRLEADVVPGDIVQAGIAISNSEVGMGAISIQPLVYRLVCSNGMVVNDAAMRKAHLGRGNESGENYELFSNETLMADDRAPLMKIQDTVRAAVDQARFEQVVAQMREAKDAKITGSSIPRVVELASNDFGFSKSESGGILDHLIRDGDLSLLGLANAVTRYSQDVDSYDRATSLESIGYDILTMSGSHWRRLNAA